ncbi:usher syndrome type-1G protein [Caerostris darwini]|uniref:Usher syndrome type-1G protein n=1 Tax=Caerostris darwini TaxID=1538125 RepID=A0AAV4VPZ8_9ARAC|nr:usher syndrome type-1G protein [Caerostris darwini]
MTGATSEMPTFAKCHPRRCNGSPDSGWSRSSAARRSGFAFGWGDPDKCDHYGNTSLHCASGNGHTDCVSFLVHFGVNLWALDNDFHTAKDVAVLGRRDDALRLLDQAEAKHALLNRKLVQRLREKSVYDAERRVKHYRKRQAKAAKRAEKEEKERAQAGKDSRSSGAPKFSDIVNSGDKKDLLTRRITPKKKSVVFRPGDILRRDSSDVDTKPPDDRTTRSDSSSAKESDDGTSSPDRPASDTHSNSDDAYSDVLQTADSGIGEDIHEGHISIFERPGFGTVTFRNSVVHFAGVDDHPSRDSNRNLVHARNSGRGCAINDSIGSASSLVRRHITWEDECEVYDEDDDEASEDDDEEDLSNDEDDAGSGDDPLSMLLAAVGLSEYMPLFQSEQIDLEALSLLSEEDLKALGMPLGPRRKLGKAVQERIKVLEDPGVVQDSRL